MIFTSLSLQELSSAVQVCRMWREAGETPALWSKLTVTVDESNRDIVHHILTCRRMEAVTKIVINGGVTMSEEGWMSVIEHGGLTQMEVRVPSSDNGSLASVEPSLLARVITRMEEVKVWYEDLTPEQMIATFREICNGSTLTLKLFHIEWSAFVLEKVKPELVARAVTRLEDVYLPLYKEQLTAVLREICDRSAISLKSLGLQPIIYNMKEVDSGLLAQAVTKLEKVSFCNVGLEVEQITAILNAISSDDGSVMKLKILDISRNLWGLKMVDPRLVAKAVTRLQELDITGVDLDTEQNLAIREAVERSSCRVIGLQDSYQYWETESESEINSESDSDSD